MLNYRDFPLIAACSIAVYFVVLIWPGFSMHFAPDDMHNMYTYWEPGPWRVIQANVLFATPFYRPLAGFFYLPLFRFFGFNPLPYRVVIFALVCVNTWLLYALARRVTGSREAGGFAVLLGCFHPSAAAVFYSTAMIYEVLCFGFMCATLLLYVRVRASGRTLSWRELVAVAVLFICALNSKEMAVVVPALLVAYELIYRGWRRLSWRQVAPIFATGVMAAAYLAAKLSPANSLVGFDAYRPVYTWNRFVETSNRYAGYLFWTQDLSTMETIGFWVLLLLLAAVLRRRSMLFGAVFAFVSYLPLNFVPPRDGFVLYIPLIGFAIYAADLLVALLDFAAAHVSLGGEYRRQLPALVFAMLLGVLSTVHAPPATQLQGVIFQAQSGTWHMIEEFQRVHPHAAKGSHLLLVDSPIENDWDIYFTAKLYFNDHSLKVSWVRPHLGRNVITGDAQPPFEHELRWADDRLTETR